MQIWPAKLQACGHPRAGRNRPLALALSLSLGQFAACISTGQAAPPPTVTNPWFRYVVPQVPAGGYMTLRNSSDRNIVLTGTESPACGMLMSHKTSSTGGMETMAPMPAITIPAHGTFAFTPGGYHLMCMQPAMTPGQSVPVTLTFQDGQQVVASFVVRNASGKGANQ